MRVVLQRALDASVEIGGTVAGRIEKGFLLLVGIGREDSEEDADYLVRKISGMRVFEDEEGKMNLSLLDISGQILSVSQFTLYADTRKGNRPGFAHAAPPERAERLYQYFNRKLEESGIEVQTGVFGADMKVSFVNDGPVTILLDSKSR